jgi:hypothetical protein
MAAAVRAEVVRWARCLATAGRGAREQCWKLAEDSSLGGPFGG